MRRILYWIVVGVTSIYVGMSSYVFFFPSTWESELWISFLPYWLRGGIARCICLVIIWLLSSISIQKKLIVIFGIITCVAVAWYWRQWDAFYTNIRVGDTHRDEAVGFSLFYANIWADNTYIEEIHTAVQSYNPDVILFVEYTPEHHAILYPLLQDSYPYVTEQYTSTTVAGNVVYAKHPFTNLAPTLEKDDQRQYGYISLEYNETRYVIYVIHTSAPVNTGFFAMRNRQLDDIGRELYLPPKHHDEDHVLVIGDFNVTPWSPWYEVVKDALGPSMVNMLAYTSPTFTRSLFGNPYLLQASIDHVRTNTPEDIITMKKVPIQGSDHDGWLLLMK